VTGVLVIPVYHTSVGFAPLFFMLISQIRLRYRLGRNEFRGLWVAFWGNSNQQGLFFEFPHFSPAPRQAELIRSRWSVKETPNTCVKLTKNLKQAIGDSIKSKL
jgi:hypothetical protein